MTKSRHVPYHAESWPLPIGFNGKLAGPYRWFSGRPLNGARYTDATAFHYGTRALDPSGKAWGFHFLPGYKRFLYARLPLMAAPVVAAAAALEPEKTGLSGVGLATLGAWELDKLRRTRRFRREVVDPVAQGVAKIVQAEYVKGRGHLWVAIPEDFRDNPEAKIEINLPGHFLADDGDMARVMRQVAKRLSMDEDLATSWSLGGHRPHVTLSMPAKPPGLVTPVDVQDRLMATEDDGKILLGLGSKAKHVDMDLSLDSPHVLIAGGSGVGKSELIATMVGTFMRRGYGVLVFDAKYISHMWLRDIPGVFYADDAESQHDGLIWLDEEITRRAKAAAAGADPRTFTPLVAVLEEMTTATNKLRGYWKSIKTSEDPQMSPALTALSNLASMGRELRVHIIMAGQSLTAKAIGGVEARANFAARLFGRADASAWRTLAPHIKPYPSKRTEPGRWYMVVGDTLTEFQAPFQNLKNRRAEIVAWATNGAMGAPVDTAAMVLTGGGGGAQERETPSSEPPTPAGISLRMYAEESGVELKTLNRWRERRSDFPQWVGIGARGVHLFDRDHLRDYVRSRLREPATADEV